MTELDPNNLSIELNKIQSYLVDPGLPTCKLSYCDLPVCRNRTTAELTSLCALHSDQVYAVHTPIHDEPMCGMPDCPNAARVNKESNRVAIGCVMDHTFDAFRIGIYEPRATSPGIAWFDPNLPHVASEDETKCAIVGCPNAVFVDPRTSRKALGCSRVHSHAATTLQLQL